MTKRLVAALFAIAAIAWARSAVAQQQCMDPTNLPNPVFMSFGETQIPLVRALGKNLRDNENITLIWRASGSCPNLESLYQQQPMTGNLSYIPAGYDGTSPPPTCAAPTAGVVPDIADSVVFVDACPLTKPANIGDFRAAAQPFAFVVPNASSQQAITAEEAYFVFGFGMPGMVTPWIDEMFNFILPVSKGTTINLAAVIGVPLGKWRGNSQPTLDMLANLVGTSTNPDKTIGILGSGTYEEFRNTIRPLAFRGFKQYHAYYPNSTATSLDKLAVRDGHYTAWSYTHWLAPVDTNGVIANPTSKRVIELIVGENVTPAPAFEPIDLQIAAHFIPVCAMKVQRQSEGGDLSLYDPPEPCHCYFQSKVGVNDPSCTTCTDDSTCGGGKCRRGFCEAR